MKLRIILLISLATVSLVMHSQIFSEADSLKRELSKSKRDTTRVDILRYLSIAYEYTYPDTAMQYAQQALQLSRELNYKRGISRSHNEIGTILFLTGNYPVALDNYLQSLAIREELNDTKGIAVAASNIGQVYAEQKDYETALQYYLRAMNIDIENKSDEGLMIDYNNIGDLYQRKNMLDSALYYQQLSYQKAVLLEDIEYTGPILTSLGNVHRQLGNNLIALSYYRQSLPYAEGSSDLQNFSDTYTGMSKLFIAEKQNDSAIYYAGKAISSAMGDYPVRLLEASMLLADTYESIGKSDSALKYLHLAFATHDTLFNQEKVRQLQTLTLNEQIRQQEIEEARAEAERIRRHNLQNLGIIIFIITFGLGIYILSKRNVKARTIEFLGLMALLLLFEFIGMFVYPWIAEKADDVPIIVLVGSVIAASVLIRLHNRVEHFIKTRLVHHPVHGTERHL